MRTASRSGGVAVGGALVAAASLFVWPAWDHVLPGGSLVWQTGAAALAVAGVWWGRRQLSRGSRGAGVRLGRLAASLALLLAFAWAAGLALLWLLWPR